MSDLIDRQAILKKIEKIRQGVQMMDDTHRASIIMNGMYLCEKAVNNQPSTLPERKKGKWLIDEDGNMECPFCGNTCGFGNYCNECGADMRGDKSETD